MLENSVEPKGGFLGKPARFCFTSLDFCFTSLGLAINVREVEGSKDEKMNLCRKCTEIYRELSREASKIAKKCSFWTKPKIISGRKSSVLSIFSFTRNCRVNLVVYET